MAPEPPVCYRSTPNPLRNCLMHHLKSFVRCCPVPALVAAGGLCLAAGGAFAADEMTPIVPAVTVIKAQKACFSNIVEVSGIVLAREETAVRPERFGLKVA